MVSKASISMEKFPIKREAVHFIITGGTIDSYYDGPKDTVVPYKESIIPTYIKSLKLHEKTEFTEVCMKDSRDISREDQKNILDTIEKSPHKKFIITHGTYTMPDTARFLEANLKRKDITIVFTGSMVPIDFPKTDSTFNLGYSLSEVHHLPKGIFVCMTGRIFVPAEIAKLLSEGRFISIFSNE
tara:strand:+ start:45 stop:599 length:555 start_codon:yes stop_codon:yes gene_type:complete